MKRILGLGVLSVVGWALSTASVSAFSLLPKCLQHHKCENRPYNAFTPVDNCCCRCCGGGCQGPIFGNLPPMCCDMGCMASQPCYDAAPGTMMPAPSDQAPSPATPGFTPPPPTPKSVFNQTSMRWNPQATSGVEPAGYNTGYYPSYPTNYYPVNNYPVAPSMPAPYYWYNGR